MIHPIFSTPQRAGCTRGMRENLTKTGLDETLFLWRLTLPLCLWFTIVVRLKDAQRKLDSLCCQESNLKGGEDEGGGGLGEDECCWVGEGPHPTCMNIRIRLGIVRRPLSPLCVFPWCYITVCSWEIFMYVPPHLTEGVEAEEESAAGFCLHKHKTHTCSESHALQAPAPAPACKLEIGSCLFSCKNRLLLYILSAPWQRGGYL